MALIYVWMFLRLRMMHKTKVHHVNADPKEKRQAKADQRLLIQAFILCTVLLMENISFWVFPKVIQGPWASITTGWMIILSSSFNPIVYWIFNTKMREETLSLLYKTTGKTYVVPDTTRQQSQSVMNPTHIHTHAASHVGKE